MSQEQANNSAGTLDYKVHVSQYYENYYLDPSESDVTLLVDGQKVPAHKLIISAESKFFKALLYGNFAERNQREVAIQDVSYASFLLILQYMYSKVIDLTKENVDVVVKALELTHRFGLKQLEKGFEKYLISILSVQNVLKVFPIARLFGGCLFSDVCRLIDNNEEEVLELKEFVDLESVDACDILSRQRTTVSEVKVFRHIQRWIEKNPGNLDILKCVDFSRLNWSEIAQTVQSSKLYEDSFLFEMIRSKGFEIKAVTNCEYPEYFQSTGNNLSRAKSILLDGESVNAFIVELEMESSINHIQMKTFTTGYKVAVSKNQKEWTEVLDYSNFMCIWWKRDVDLYFPTVDTKFIQLSSKRWYGCNSFKVFQTADVPKLIDGFICPTGNEDIKARVTDNNYVVIGELKVLWRKFEEKKLETPYVTEPEIQFNQPYYVNNIRFRLWDYDGRKQAYKVQVKGKCGAEYFTLKESKEEVDGWQKTEFPPLPINYLSINGCLDAEKKIRVAFLEIFYNENL